MREKAILVDGVGGTRTMQLPKRLHEVRMALPRHFSAHIDDAPVSRICADDVGFEYLGELPDRTLVYGYKFKDGEPFALWRVHADWVPEISRDESAVNEIGREMMRQVEDLSPNPPLVVLYDVKTPTGRTIAGVARQPRKV